MTSVTATCNDAVAYSAAGQGAVTLFADEHAPIRSDRGASVGILQRLPNWIAPTTPRSTYVVNYVRGCLWTAFGVYGLATHIHAQGWQSITELLSFETDLADSIAVLFIISVYALAGNSFGKAQMARVEMNR